MAVRYPAPETVPGDLYGKRERDPLLRMIGGAATVYMRSLRFIHRKDVIPLAADHWMPMVVTERGVLADDEDVVSLALAAPGGGELPAWRPGAHIDLRLPSGRQRQYSLCGDPADSRAYRIAVRRIPNGGGGSIEVHDDLVPGSEILVKGPHNAFAFAAPGHGSTADHVHFVAAGIGITPILPMVRLAHRLGLNWTMTYTGRSRESLPFLEELESLGSRVTVRTDDVDGIPDASELLANITPTTAIYCCGPVPLIGALREHVRAQPEVEFHFERFSAPPVVDGTDFDIELARTGDVITVPADRSALDVIREYRPDIAYSCQQGFCGTCRVAVQGGRPDHRDTALTPDEREQGSMLICVSRSRGDRLVLDL